MGSSSDANVLRKFQRFVAELKRVLLSGLFMVDTDFVM